jgi:hypothetical protein
VIVRVPILKDWSNEDDAHHACRRHIFPRGWLPCWQRRIYRWLPCWKWPRSDCCSS